jgi:hypothetical protein
MTTLASAALNTWSKGNNVTGAVGSCSHTPQIFDVVKIEKVRIIKKNRILPLLPILYPFIEETNRNVNSLYYSYFFTL